MGHPVVHNISIWEMITTMTLTRTLKLMTTLNRVPGHVDWGVLLVQQQGGEGVEQHRRLLRGHLGGGRGYPGLDV